MQLITPSNPQKCNSIGCTCSPSQISQFANIVTTITALPGKCGVTHRDVIPLIGHVKEETPLPKQANLLTCQAPIPRYKGTREVAYVLTRTYLIAGIH